MKRPLKTIAAIMLTIVMVICIIGCNKPENNDVRVTTYTPQDITATTAKCGGDVIVTQGLSLDELGVCWSTDSNPTAEDAHISTTNCNSTYVCTITGLNPKTKYHVRAYALRGLEYYYGEDRSFTTENIGGNNGTCNGHEYVDLGLPSGILWATCNLGAETSEECGDYYAWGETRPKEVYVWNNYKFCYEHLSNAGLTNQLTKYCWDYNCGHLCFTDTLTILVSEDDAASANWGIEWRIPTKEEWEELYLNTTNNWATQNGIKGRLFTASNGNSLFLPAAGHYDENLLINYSWLGSYWSSSLNTNNCPCYAWTFSFIWDDSFQLSDGITRHEGLSIRPVHKEE